MLKKLTIVLALTGALAACGTAAPQQIASLRQTDAVQQALDALVRDDGFPGALATVGTVTTPPASATCVPVHRSR